MRPIDLLGPRERAALCTALTTFGVVCILVAVALDEVLSLSPMICNLLLIGGTLAFLVGVMRLKLAASGEEPFTRPSDRLEGGIE